MHVRSYTTCHACEAPISQPAHGRRRRFCRDTWRQRYCCERQRKRAEAVSQVKKASRNAA